MNNIGSKSQSNINNLDYNELEKIYSNEELLNYKELCKRLNIKECAGNSKTKQLKELMGVCKFERIGQKYKIIEISDKETIDLFNNRSIYIPYIQIILSHLFEQCCIKNNKNEMYFSTRELMFKIGMINENFKAITGKDMYFNCSLVAKENGFNQDNLYKFAYKGYNSVLKPIIKSALKSMKNSKSIEIIDGYKLYKKVKISDKQTVISYKYTNVNEDLGKEIFMIEGNTMSAMNISGSNELYGRKAYLKDEYYNNCNKIIKEKSKNDELFKENKWDYDGFYRAYLIIVNNKRLTNNIKDLRDEFNQIIQDKMYRTKTLKFLTGEELDIFVKATIDTLEENEYNFKNDIRKQEKIYAESILNEGSNYTTF